MFKSTQGIFYKTKIHKKLNLVKPREGNTRITNNRNTQV